LPDNMSRYIMASVRVHFSQKLVTYPIYYEHTNPKNLIDSNGKEIRDYYEFRLDGPYKRKLQGPDTWYYVEINILIQSLVDPKYADRIEEMIDEATSGFAEGIPVYKYVDTDPPEYVGCLELLEDDNEQIHCNRFAQANPDTKVLQASVEGHYRMKLQS